MRLTELIGELQDRLSAVARTQARVQQLLDAFLSVSTGLDLDTTLRRLVESAVGLVDARYGALGVLRDSGDGLAQFITVGMADDDIARLGHSPEGKGVLGLLIREPYPLRIPDVAAHPAAVGFPPGHPPMHTFLGVPVLVRGEAFGNLYLTEKRHGEFTAEDEAVLTALAGAAGIAIDNARLYEQSENRRRWLAAIADVRAILLGAGSSDQALSLIAERVATHTDSRAAWLLRGPDLSDGSYTVTAQCGADLRDLVGQRLSPDENPVLSAVSGSEGAITLDVAAMEFRRLNPAIDWGPCIAIPLRGTYASDAVVIAARAVGAPPFDESIAPLISTFVDQAFLALDMAERQRLGRQLDLYADRDRIARDLHDHIIQRVFAAGLALQAVLPRVADPHARSRLQAVVGQLDETVRDIRTTIFDLHTTDDDETDSLRRRLLDVVTEAAADRLQPTVRMSGPVDSLVTGSLAADVEAVVREAVSNAARHSGGRHVTVTIEVSDRVVVDVVDDGRGIDPRVARSGLRNLEERAAARGGEAGIEALHDGGTRLRWLAPLR